jgi:hypothetical protein
MFRFLRSFQILENDVFDGTVTSFRLTEEIQERPLCLSLFYLKNENNEKPNICKKTGDI